MCLRRMCLALIKMAPFSPYCVDPEVLQSRRVLLKSASLRMHRSLHS